MRFVAEANLSVVIRRDEHQVDPVDTRARLNDRVRGIFAAKALEAVPFPGGPFNVPDEVATAARSSSCSPTRADRAGVSHKGADASALPGFGREPAAVMTFLTPTTRFTPDEARAYTRRLLDRFRALPGVEAVGAISNLHLNPLSTQSSDFNVDGFEPPADYGAFVADRAEVDPGFFEAAGIEIVHGRNFDDADRPDSRPVAVVSEAMARRFWPDGDAVGRLVRRRDDDDPAWLVVGVASDAKVRTLGEAPRNMVYLPYSQRFRPLMTVVARTSLDPEGTALALLAAGRALDPDLWVFETKTMDRHLALMRLPQQLSAFVLSAFGVLALALAAGGLYSVVGYGVARRTREIGIRMALGADGGRVVRLLVAGA